MRIKSAHSESPGRQFRSGFVEMDLIVAFFLIMTLVMPIGVLLSRDAMLFRAHSIRIRAASVLDGEMELLQAGLWKQYPESTIEYYPKSASSLKGYGKFLLSLEDGQLELSWIPSKKYRGGRISRTWKKPEKASQ